MSFLRNGFMQGTPPRMPLDDDGDGETDTPQQQRDPSVQEILAYASSLAEKVEALEASRNPADPGRHLSHLRIFAGQLTDLGQSADWLQRFASRAEALSVPREDWTPLALALVEGPASEALKARVNLSMPFNELSEQILAVSTHDVIDAVAQLDSLRMRHTVDSLATKFRQLTARLPTDCSRSVLTAWFVAKLRDSIRPVVAASNPSTLEEAIALAKRVETAVSPSSSSSSRRFRPGRSDGPRRGNAPARGSQQPRGEQRAQRKFAALPAQQTPPAHDPSTHAGENTLARTRPLCFAGVSPAMTAVAHLVVNNEPARVLVDTGCEVSMASPDLTNLLFSPCPVVQVRHNEEVVNLTRSTRATVRQPGGPCFAAELYEAPIPARFGVQVVLGADVLSRCDLCVSLNPVKLTQLPADQQPARPPPHAPSSTPQRAATTTPPSRTEKKRPPVKQVAAMSVKSYVDKGECEWVVAAVPAIPLEHSVSERDVTELCEEFADVFEEHERLPPSRPGFDFDVRLQPGAATPPYVRYKLSPAERAELDTTIDDLLAKGSIAPSNSPFAAPVLFVKKKDGSMRFCVDYRRLNAATVPDRYPLPDLQTTLAAVAGRRIYSTMDLRAGFQQLRVKKDAQPLTAFACERGQFQWTVMPFGVQNGPPAFQRLMDHALHGLRGVVVYIDDIIVAADSQEEHATTLRLVFERLRRHGLRLKRSKCCFGRSSVPFLGHVVDANGIHVDPEKVAAFRRIPAPTTKKDAQSFVGCVNFYRRFLPRLEDTLGPLRSFMQTGVWTSAAAASFEQAKDALADAAALVVPQRGKPFDLRTDASDFALGAVLEQDGRPVEFFSRRLKPAERNYTVREKELLAVVASLQKWRHHVGFDVVRVHTDHRALLDLQSQSKLAQRRLFRWSEALADFHVQWTFVPGRDNVVADALSRLIAPLPTPGSTAPPLSTDYAGDPAYKTALASTNPPFAWQGDVLTFNGRRCVTKPDVPAVLHAHHDVLGHPGFARTMAQLQRWLYWPGMHADVKAYISSCHPCLSAKSGRITAPPLQPAEVPTRPWEHVSVDFFTGVPRVDGCDMVAVFVDSLTKMVHLAPCAQSLTAADAAHLLLRVVISKHGTPTKIVSDRDPRFTAATYRHIAAAIGMRPAFTTAAHPQADGQSERAVRTAKQTLRALIEQRDGQLRSWLPLLPIVEFSMNSAPSTTTGLSPFEANYGFSPSLTFSTPSADSTAEAADFIANLRVAQAHCADALHLRASTHVPVDSRSSSFAAGDLVYVSTNLIRDPHGRPSRQKLAPQFLGPVRVKSATPHTVTLDLPSASRMHRTVNVRYVKPAPAAPRGVDLPPPVAGADIYEADCITAHRQTRKGPQFLVRWKGYSSIHDTWEYADAFLGEMALSTLRDYASRNDLQL